MNFNSICDSVHYEPRDNENEHRQHGITTKRNFHTTTPGKQSKRRKNIESNSINEKKKRKIGVFFGKISKKIKETNCTGATGNGNFVERRRGNEQLSNVAGSSDFRFVRNRETEQRSRSVRLGHFFHISKRSVRRQSLSEKLLSHTGIGNSTLFDGARNQMEGYRSRSKANNSGWITGHKHVFTDTNDKLSDNGQDAFDNEKISNVQSRIETNGQFATGVDMYTTDDKIYGDNAIRILASELYVRHLGKHGRYISDICVPATPEDFTQLLQEFRSNLFGAQRKPNGTGQWRLVSRHGDHFHVLHICTYSNATCRCTWLDRSPTWRRCRRTRFRRRVYVSDLSLHDWENIIRYFSTKGHTIQNIESGGEDGGLRLRIENIQVI